MRGLITAALTALGWIVLKGIANQGQRHNSDDEKHKRAERTHWQVTSTTGVIATGAAIVAAVFAAGAYQAANEQAKIAQNTLIASSRPWVMLANVRPLNLSSDDADGVTLWAKISVKNIGHSPAENLFITGKLLIDQFDPSPQQGMEEACQEARLNSSTIRGQVLFPDQSEDLDGGIPQSFLIDVDKVWASRAARIKSAYEAEMARGKSQLAEEWKGALAEFPFHADLHFVGCVSYRSSTSKTLYQTSFMFDLGSFPLLGGKPPVIHYPEPEPNNPDILMLFSRQMQRIVPGDKIKLSNFTYGTFVK